MYRVEIKQHSVTTRTSHNNKNVKIAHLASKRSPHSVQIDCESTHALVANALAKLRLLDPVLRLPRLEFRVDVQVVFVEKVEHLVTSEGLPKAVGSCNEICVYIRRRLFVEIQLRDDIINEPPLAV